MSGSADRPFASPNPGWPGFTKNAAIGNTTAGVSMRATQSGPPGPQPDSPGVWMYKSNLYGNGDSAANCGAAIDNEYPDATVRPIGSFYNDYWGATTGPGPNPADIGGGTSGSETDLCQGTGCTCTTGPDLGGVYFYSGEPATTELTITENALK